MRHIRIAALLVLAASTEANAQNAVGQLLCSLVKDINPFTAQWVVSDRAYFKPLRSEPRAAQTTATLGTATSVRFLEHQPSMVMWDIDVGSELPLYGGEHRCRGDDQPDEPTGTGGHTGPGTWGFGLWFPIDFHMMESLDDPSAPILNTDYRFGLMLKGEYNLGQAGGGRFLSLRLRAGHESTHLGDEYSIRSAREHPAEFERINVSYEYLDGAIGFNGMTSYGNYGSHLGVIHTAKPWHRSYYGVTEVGDYTVSPIQPVTPTTREYEPYLGAELERDKLDWNGFKQVPGLRWLQRWGGYVSVDTRSKTIYDYHKSSGTTSDDTQWSTNAVFGIYPHNGGTVAIQARAYYGVNPHGQFRSQRNFHLFGVGLHLNR